MKRPVVVYDHIPLPPLPDPPAAWRYLLAALLQGIARRLTSW